MINKTKETEEIYRKKQKEFQSIREFDIEMEKQDLEDHFRKVDLSIESIQELKVKHEENFRILQAKLNDLKWMKLRMKNCDFKTNEE